ncbi:Transcriptional regulatory protein ZraR [bacterium HR40]|nr:Transcriptional regulatory protein ZraR [bacterium HR40]
MRLLIVGRNAGDVAEASRIAAGRGARVRHVPDFETALEELRAGRGADLLLVELGIDVARVIAALRRERIFLPVVAYGVDAEPAEAAAAIKAGAIEFLPFPPDADAIAALLEGVSGDPGEFVASDPKMREVLELARVYARSDASVLLIGESGTGKERLARFLHEHSPRASGPFVSVNCAAIPDSLLESELFGHEKGAFTGAVARRVGKFEEANGGTLLLDEISEMDVRLQAKLLRAIQEREIDRLGGSGPIRVDIRLIATTNRAIEEEVAAGRFREDLYFRLSVLVLEIPPLRERPGDIRVLAEHFARRFARANGLPHRPFTERALAKLRGHVWRGNVRELENVVHRAVLLARGQSIDEEAILLRAPGMGREERTAGSVGPTTSTLVGRSVAEVERELILDTLRHTLGNRTRAAHLLGISIRTLRNKLREYAEAGIPIPPALQG